MTRTSPTVLIMDADEFLELVDYIETPPANPGRLYDAGDGKPSLQCEMGLQYAPDHFRAILSVIREVWRDLGVDIRAPYGSQDKALMRAVKKEALKRMPFLRIQYENGWPVTFYLKRSLKGGHSRKGKKRVEPRPVGPISVCRESSTATASPCPVNGGSNILHAIDPTNRITCGVTSCGPTFARSVSATTSSSSSASPSTSPTAVSVTQATTSSRPLDSQPLLDLLLSFRLPRADAERLSAVFASHGIVNVAYLRVLGGLQSRDYWLEDLRAKVEFRRNNASIEFIRTPSRIPHKIYEIGDGYITLQHQMGLQGSLKSFKRILSGGSTESTHRVAYALQDPTLLSEVKEEVIRRLPNLYEDYEDAWPITFYLKRAFRYVRREHYKPTGTKRYIQEHVATVSATTAATEHFSGPNAGGSDLHDEERSQSCSASGTENMLSSRGTMAGEIYKLLVDARRIVQLFASFGIKDLAYLRVFARMHSRDGWLDEMHQKGELSEI
ncbi:hypothetical protein C8T65DRAFT_693998 [Cerioporus squamosus]|nr:hypothetical protein C8T65DRAFT_693998 [Cerioporus squamosus]